MATDLTAVPTADLVAELNRLNAIKAWGPRLASVQFELHRRQPVELAQDAYYYGTAADFRTAVPS